MRYGCMRRSRTRAEPGRWAVLREYSNLTAVNCERRLRTIGPRPPWTTLRVLPHRVL